MIEKMRIAFPHFRLLISSSLLTAISTLIIHNEKELMFLLYHQDSKEFILIEYYDHLPLPG
jgi:hypothetical protein